jgi:glycosyltransferase involved in cell wall biosynthesis
MIATMSAIREGGRRPRIVVASPWLPYPLDSGNKQRMFNVLRALASLGDVDFACYVDPRRDGHARDLGPLRALCHSLHLLPTPVVPAGPPRGYGDVLRQQVLGIRPYFVTEYQPTELVACVERLAATADLVWISRIFLAEWLNVPHHKTVVDLDDLESVKEHRRLRLLPLRPWQLVKYGDNIKLWRVERRSASRYARVALCSEADRAFFSPRLRGRVLVLPNGVDAALLEVPRPAPTESSIVMVGNFRYFPNIDGAQWLVQDVMPRVWASLPDARVYLIGDDAQGALRPLHDGTRVIVTGRVDDVIPHVSGAALSAVPIRVAGGTRIKILESLALRTPVIATTIGAEGLDVVDGQHIRLADSPEAFAQTILETFMNYEAAADMARAGARLVRTQYTWDSIRARLADELRPLVDLDAPRSGVHREPRPARSRGMR